MAPEYRTRRELKIDCVIDHRGSLAQFCYLALLFSIITIAVGETFSGCRHVPKLTAQEMEGKHLYQARCAHCHQDNDLALKKIPPDLHGLFNKSTLPSGAPATDAQVRQVVLAGKGMMPAFAGRFDDPQMAALLAYLHTGLR